MVLFASFFSFNLIQAQTTIDNAYFSSGDPTYQWDMAGSPYLIIENIEILESSNLLIDPGVSVIFQGDFKMNVRGAINAMGNANERITITSDIEQPWAGIRFDFSDDHTVLTTSRIHYCDISNAHKTGTVCTSADPESSGGAIYTQSFSDLEIIECEIFNNSVQAHGGAIGLFEGSSPLLRRNHIHHNFALLRGGGIAMFISCSPEIDNNNITINEAKKGGGGIAMGALKVSNAFCYPIIHDNNITNNLLSSTSYGEGGGVFICSSKPSFYSNNLSGNTCNDKGGAVYIKNKSEVTFVNNTFNENQADNIGGGIYCDNSDVILTNCAFVSNNSDIGGGIYISGSVSSIQNCTFESNTASGNGGGVYLYDPVSNTISLNTFTTNEAYDGSAIFYYRDHTNLNLYYQNQTKILNNMIFMNYANHRGSVYFSDNNINTVFNHNTVTNNTSSTSISGLVVDEKDYFPDLTASSCNFNNNIVYGNTNVIYIVTATPLEWSYFLMDIYASPNCTYATNPGFVSSSDYHLSSSSTCIDVGDNNALMTTFDLDGNPRINNGTTDFGCFEY